MKVGLIRHFKVKRGYPSKVLSSEELMQWVTEYDESDVEVNSIDLGGIEWKRCYSSDLPRASTTAKAAFRGDITYLEELRELQLAPLFRSNIRLPLKLHVLLIRLAWLLNHRSQPVRKKELKQLISTTLDQILAEDGDVLVVSHGGVMMFLRKELIRRGFQGPDFKVAANGELYVFERNDKL